MRRRKLIKYLKERIFQVVNEKVFYDYEVDKNSGLLEAYHEILGMIS